MVDPRIRLKNPWIAGILGFLIPGAGHLYQGRLFKAAVYFTCILGLFCTGMAMADWKAVYVHRPGNRPAKGKHHMLQFLAQAGVGLPAVCALVQNKRFYSPENEQTRELSGPITATFFGEVQPDGKPDVNVHGVIELAPSDGRFGKSVSGRFIGVDDDGADIELQLGGEIKLQEQVNADRRRELDVDVVEGEGDAALKTGELEGSIPRPFKDWFVVPVKTRQESDLHAKLGKFHELAMVFTWVAGLLNILAVWDALEGPAYGYGDEESEPQSKDRSTSSGSGPPSRSGRTPAQATT